MQDLKEIIHSRQWVTIRSRRNFHFWACHHTFFLYCLLHKVVPCTRRWRQLQYAAICSTSELLYGSFVTNLCIPWWSGETGTKCLEFQCMCRLHAQTLPHVHLLGLRRSFYTRVFSVFIIGSSSQSFSAYFFANAHYYEWNPKPRTAEAREVCGIIRSQHAKRKTAAFRHSYFKRWNVKVINIGKSKGPHINSLDGNKCSAISECKLYCIALSPA